MKLLSFTIIAISFLTAGLVVKRESNASLSPPLAPMTVEERLVHSLPNRKKVQEEAILKRMDEVEHRLEYLKGRIDAQKR